MKEIIVKEISATGDKKKFFKFIVNLYKKNEYAAPSLYADEMAEFDPKTNDAFRFCECKMFLAYRGKKVVGRIAGIWHKFVNEKNNVKQLRFTRFDVIDDFDVTKALFSKLVEWAKELGMEEIVGPMSFSDLNEEGMLIEGFDRDSTYIEIYNYPYYVEHMQKLGAYKVVDWNCYRIKVPEKRDEKLMHVANRVQQRNGYEIVDVATLAKNKDKKTLKKIFIECLEVLDKSFEKLYGTSAINEKQMAREADSLLQVFVPQICCAVRHEGKIVGYGFALPTLHKVLNKGRGHILPRGLIPYIQTMSHPKVVELLSVGVLDEHQNRGVTAIIVNEILGGIINIGAEWMEAGPELEDNLPVQHLWNSYEKELHKRHRCWGLNVAELDKTLNG
ncbi:MAG: hypothetical protein NC132_05430 [Corallococcus sp.]|nr:hypothetical protein [Corallococcus sp.]MCM1359979.1 hypothetical protein [Corallococcus sp.]MCM1395536.1 hypothetical protein [Corallococcus sp.]